MTTDREQIIAAAREAGMSGLEEGGLLENFERFYAIAFEAGAASRDAEIAELKAQQCTSPFADSPPCRGIQRERDTIAELVRAISQAHIIGVQNLIDKALAKVRKP